MTEAMRFCRVCECVWLGLAGCVLGLMFQIMHIFKIIGHTPHDIVIIERSSSESVL